MTAYSLHPDVVVTNIGSKTPLSSVLKVFLNRKTLDKYTARTLYCALKPGLENETGRYFDDSTVTNLADKWTDEEINTFWQWTEKVIEERTSQLK